MSIRSSMSILRYIAKIFHRGVVAESSSLLGGSLLRARVSNDDPPSNDEAIRVSQTSTNIPSLSDRYPLPTTFYY